MLCEARQHRSLKHGFCRRQTHVSCLAGGFFTTEPPGKPVSHLSISSKFCLHVFYLASVGRECQDFGDIKVGCPIEGAQLKSDGCRVRERERVCVCVCVLQGVCLQNHTPVLPVVFPETHRNCEEPLTPLHLGRRGLQRSLAPIPRQKQEGFV